MSKRFLILLLFTCLQIYNVKSGNAFYPEPTFFTEDENYFLHTVEKGQTVFSIASMYYVSVDEIYELNPQSKTLIKIGEKLKIPQESGSYIYHVIQPQETLYALSQKYQMKGEDIFAVNPGLSVQTFQIGKVVRIPVNRVNTPVKGGNDAINRLKTNSLLNQILPTQTVKTIQVALLLPFGLKENASGENNSVDRMVEYYEGFLLALKTLKSKKISVDLQVYDIGSETKEVSNILKKEEMQTVHLIIGGISEEQIKIISRFSNEKNIPYVIPFTSMSNEPFNNPMIYQVNTPQAIQYAKASATFINKYRNYRIILVSGEKDASNQSEFITLLRNDLQEKKLPFKTIPLKRFSDTDFVSELDSYKDNVFVSDDDSPTTIEKMITPLKSVQESHPEYRISLFGYPRWQTYSSKYSEGFFNLHTSFFSVFYTDVTSPEIKDFYDTFYKWYGRNISNNFPKFGLLGYDTGMYFLQAIYIHGTSFDKEINELRYKGLQTDFYFERVNNWGGFINTNLYVVNYNPDNSITKTSLK
jgi:LysM repeat protein